ncbi:unnamed protein product [Calypogeia fissa]
MSVPTTPAGISIPKRSESALKKGSAENGPSSSLTSPVVERFYEKHFSFKAKKAPPINEDEIRTVFDHFDENKDGRISQEDLQHFMGRLGIDTTEDDILNMVTSVDANGDGSVDFSEFASLYQMIANDGIRADGPEDEDLKDAFKVFDKNEDGFISPTELQEVLLKLGVVEGTSLTNCEKMIRNVDADGNGGVDFCEFKKMMTGDFGGS